MSDQFNELGDSSLETRHVDAVTSEQHPHHPDRESLATVHPLPVHQDQDADHSGEPAGEVMEGELVSDAEYELLTCQKAQAIARWQGYRRDLVTAARFTRTVATHDYTQTAGRTALRQVVYVGGGAKLVAQRVWEARTNSRYERMLRAAEIHGDWDRLAEWEQRAEQARQRRHQRRMDWLEATGKPAKAATISAGSLIAALLALGVVLATASKDISLVIAPITAVFELIRWITWVITIAWGPLVLAAPWIALGALWSIGRRHDQAPRWLMPAAQRGGGDPITPSAVVAALRDLGIPALRKAILDLPDAGASTGPAGLLVVDLDVPKSPDDAPPPGWSRRGAHSGFDVFAMVCADAGQPVPAETFTVRTARGGHHLYFRAPTGVRLGSTDGENGRGLGWKVDTRGWGGHVVAAGSTTPAGRYTVIRDVPVAP